MRAWDVEVLRGLFSDGAMETLAMKAQSSKVFPGWEFKMCFEGFRDDAFDKHPWPFIHLNRIEPETWAEALRTRTIPESLIAALMAILLQY